MDALRGSFTNDAGASSLRAGTRGALLGFVLLLGNATGYAEDRPSVHKVPPVYPELAKRMHIVGMVKVVATIDAAGSVVKAESDSPNKMLAPAAVDAVKHWKFAPGEGTSTVTVQISFELGA